MRISRLEIDNFRAISRIALNDLRNTIVIAGPNGCGKSCILDAIRLAKSAYGEYQPNELHHWLNEFLINAVEKPELLANLLQDRSRPLRVLIEIQFAEPEKVWLRSFAENLLRRRLWSMVAPETAGWANAAAAGLSPRYRERQEEVERRLQIEMRPLLNEVNRDSHVGQLTIEPSGTFSITRSSVLEIAFGTYDPKNLGVVDYHGPQRNYVREHLGGINLNAAANDDQLRQHALYNYANKYGQIKTALAAGYLRERLLADAGAGISSSKAGLSETLRELFATFFPGKQFLGPQPTPDGTLEFTVKTESGAIHDINDLSSGEKELLFGYLRLHNTAPHNSIILIDEPELHLNPRLTQGLPQFYHQHLGRDFGNQLWLITHSDAILRQAVGQKDFSVFHMTPPGGAAVNQAREVRVAKEVERAVIDLVGDLAAYRPGAKIVIVEGGGDSDFDVHMVGTLFPEFQSRVNLISGGNSYRVRDLHMLLEEARATGGIPGKFYSITDRDFGDEVSQPTGRTFSWDRYHIENYLLEPEYIRRVVHDLDLSIEGLNTNTGIEEALRESASKTLTSLIRIQLEGKANHHLVDCIKTRIDPKAQNLADSLLRVIQTSAKRLSEVVNDTLSIDRLRDLEATLESRFREDFDSGEWKRTFRGRDILKRFVGDHLKGRIGYMPFRNLILSRMRDDAFQPQGMKVVLDQIQAD